MINTKTATELNTKLRADVLGSWKHYKLSTPLEDNKYVIVSTASTMVTGPETYIFPSNKNGEVVSWSELPGSFRGGLNHEMALKNAGYSVK